MHSDPFPKADGNEFVGFYINLEKVIVRNVGRDIHVDIPNTNEKGVSTDNYFES